MRKIWLAIIGLVLMTGAAQAQMCGSGVQCLDAVTALSNANASSAQTFVPIYTAPITGNGAKIVAIFNYSTAVSGATALFGFDVRHNGIPYNLMSAYGSASALGAFNLLVAGAASPPPPLPNLPSDENGNPFILLSPGDTFEVVNAYAIPPSGDTSGTWYFHVMLQQY